MFIAALFIIARTWKQPKYLSINRRMHKEEMVHIYNGILLGHKRNTFESVLIRLMNSEPIIQSEGSQKENNKYHILMYIYGI